MLVRGVPALVCPTTKTLAHTTRVKVAQTDGSGGSHKVRQRGKNKKKKVLGSKKLRTLLRFIGRAEV
jgi:hypothetical protein